MFRRSFYVAPPVDHKEHYKLDSDSGYRVRTNILEDGTSVEEQYVIDLSKPQTPQSGMEVVTLDLAYAIKHNRSISNDSCLLSALDNTNPFSSFKAAKSLCDVAADNLNFLKTEEK